MATIRRINFRLGLRRFVFVLLIAGLGCACHVVAQPVTSRTVKPVAVKVFEIGSVSRGEFARRWTRENWGFNDWINQLYIINYGTEKEIVSREKVITRSIAFRNFDRNRITLVNGGLDDGGPRTVVWRVPYGADNPEL